MREGEAAACMVNARTQVRKEDRDGMEWGQHVLGMRCPKRLLSLPNVFKICHRA